MLFINIVAFGIFFGMCEYILEKNTLRLSLIVDQSACKFTLLGSRVMISGGLHL